jgi:tetratricopeptide (TPR) repeat protein
MVFGFGFNKQKVLVAAEKYVQQGKLQNAIAEYEKVTKADPKDLTVLNTIGDLYARLGEIGPAVENFRRVGDAYASEGFTVKAIAVYKKITKLQPSLEGTLRLAELYTQQGLFNDARAQYLHVAEEFLRSGELEQAVRIFQKTLEMDPDNVAMKVRLGEVYVRLGKKGEAWQIFSEAAKTLRAHGSLDAAEDILQRMFQLDPRNSDALLLRGRTALDNGDPASAIRFLEQVADVDQHADALRALLQAYMQVGRVAEAGGLATKLYTVHNDTQALAQYADALMQSGAFMDALRVYHDHADALLATGAPQVLENLRSIIGHVRDNPDSLETLLALLQKAGDTSNQNEIMELLAHASVQSGDLVKARDLYLQLASMEPQNALHARNYQQVVARLGTASGPQPITSEEGALLVDELEATAPLLDQRYPEAVLVTVRTALTDAELFVSYNMPEKALGPLLAALPSAPRDVRLNQRLAALHTRTGRFAEAAMSCRTLEAVYRDSGYATEAARYGELASKYEERAALAAEAAAVDAAPAPWPAAPDSGPMARPAVESASSPEAVAAPESQEVDLSEEWEGAVAPAEDSVPEKAGAVEETVAEVRFYLEHSMLEQARAAMAKLETMTQDGATLAPVRAEIAAHAATPVPDAAVVEFSVQAEPEQEAEDTAGVASPAHHGPASLGELVAELESELPTDFLADAIPAHGQPPQQPTIAPAEKPELAVARASAAVTPQSRAASVAPMAPWAGIPAAGAAAAPAPALSVSVPALVPTAAVPASPVMAEAGADLNDMFDEFKAELENDASPGNEDPEDHYNLGVAFREMGLIDEAIGELQKTCQAVDAGRPFSQTMQAYTWLAQCFLDKNIPEAAIRWYEKALKLPTIDELARTALHYELAAAYELASNKRAALAHFMLVYGANIDYRDVGDRIAALRG